MRRTAATDLAIGSDSFLDIVANVVGILIILVMVVGARFRQVPAEIDPEQPRQAMAAFSQGLDTLSGENRTLEAEVAQMARQMQVVDAQAELHRVQRDALATQVATAEQLLARQQEDLSEKQREAWRKQQELARAGQRLAQAQQLAAQFAQARPTAVKLYHQPTPISRSVGGKELHFQLREGRVAYVPIDELVDDLKNGFSRLAEQLRTRSYLEGTVGPLRGWQMDYTFERLGNMMRLEKIAMVPTRPGLGETQAEALLPQSEFHALLANKDPRSHTVTLWVYPDSFEAFRGVRDDLYQRGYQVAGRPLPFGTPISGSPEGAKSAAQ